MYFDFVTFFLILFAYLVPLYISNSSPLIFYSKIPKKFNFPLDFNLEINKKRILGDGKTIFGTLIGISFGTIAGAIYFFISPINLIIPNYLALAFLLALGGVSGDIIESFFKRRIGLKRGESWIVFDQIDFILGGLILSLLLRIPEIEIIVFILILTLFAHPFSNWVAFKIKLKKVPW